MNDQPRLATDPPAHDADAAAEPPTPDGGAHHPDGMEATTTVPQQRSVLPTEGPAHSQNPSSTSPVPDAMHRVQPGAKMMPNDVHGIIARLHAHFAQGRSMVHELEQMMRNAPDAPNVQSAQPIAASARTTSTDT